MSRKAHVHVIKALSTWYNLYVLLVINMADRNEMYWTFFAAVQLQIGNNHLFCRLINICRKRFCCFTLLGSWIPLQHCFNTAQCHRAHPLVTAPQWFPMGSSSPRVPASLQAPFHGLQFWPRPYFCWGPPCAAPPSGLLRGYTWISPHRAHGLQRDSLPRNGPFLGCRKLLLCTWSNSCPPSALTSVPAGLFFSHPSLLFQLQLNSSRSLS